MSDDSWWYWDLRQQRAVPAAERGPATDLLGPYRTREEAEHWKDKAELRNEQWEGEDEAWEGEAPSAGGPDVHD